jgi:hypothetical protein
MKRYLLLSILLIGMTGMNLFSQARVTCTLTVSDNVGSSQTLMLGIDTTATDGIDAALGEIERPPVPPSDAFDVRFIGDDIAMSLGQGTLADFRNRSILQNSTCVHEIKFQAKTGGTQIILGWNLPKGVSLRVQDVITGSFIDVAASGTGSYIVTNPGGINKLKLTALYDVTQMVKERATGILSVSDDVGSSQTLTMGLDSAATNGIDAALGEVERPPLPPNDAFDARFIGDDIGISLGQGTLVDFREGSALVNRTCIHEIKYQVKAGGTQIVLGWNLIKGVSLRIQDIITGSFIDVTASGTGSYTITNPSGINKLKLTATCLANAMPVELSAFTASVAGTVINLHWRTETEINNYGFSIERCIKNDRGASDAWQTIGFISGSGTCWVPKEYAFIDKAAAASQAYSYRLKQIDRDGAFEYSKVIEASTVQPTAFDLKQNYPNPFNPSTTIQVQLPNAATVSLIIYDMTGAIVDRLAENKNLGAGVYSFSWDAARAGHTQRAAGIYIVRMNAIPTDASAHAFTRNMKIVLVK